MTTITKAPMGQIRLLSSLPIGSEHGATEGRVFAVVRMDPPGRNRRVYFIGDAGEECAAFMNEYVRLPAKEGGAA